MDTPLLYDCEIKPVQFQICNSGEVWTSVSRAEAHRIARKRTGALAAIIRQHRKCINQEAREYRRAERELQSEIRESDRRNRVLWKRIRVRPEDRQMTAIERKPQAHKPTKTGWLANASQLPRYSGQIIDRMGRAGIFFRVRYYGHSTKQGVGRRSTLYIWQGAHQMDDGRVMFASNVGETAEEAVAALEAVELFNREAQAGAKLLFHAIANVPYQLLEMDGGIERMFEIGQRFAEEQFGSRDLPFSLALHPPSEEGDQRNWHLHVIFSTRPLVRTGDHQWDIGRMMRREIDNPEAFEEMRHLYARIQTEVVQEAGINITYTALSNTERGLPNAPTTHLGPTRTARVRRGEQDEVNESNWETVLVGETALLDEQLRHDQEQATAEQALLDRVQERAAPLVAGVTNGPSLAIAALAPHAEPIADLSRSADILGEDGAAATSLLAIANMQPRNRKIADVASLRHLPLSEQDDVPGTRVSRSALRSTKGSIEVPRALAKIVANAAPFSPVPSLPATRARGHQIAAMPVLATENANANAIVLALPLSSARVIAGDAGTAIAKPPSLAGMRQFTDGMGLSLGRVTRAVQRPLDVPKHGALADDAVGHDIDAIFRFLDARRAEVEARRERARREQVAAARADADRIRKAEDDERVLEEKRRQRLEAEQAQHSQVERDAADALEAMLTAIEAERILVTFDDRYVVGEAVRKRFDVMPTLIVSATTQARLDAIADRQLAEIAPISVHVSQNGGHIVHEPEGWTLSAAAPDDLRRLIKAWRHEPLLQKALANAAAAFRAAQIPPPAAMPTPTPRATGPVRSGPRNPAASPAHSHILVLAAGQREAAMRRWEQNGGLNDGQPTLGPAHVPAKLAPVSTPPARRPVPPSRDQGRCGAKSAMSLLIACSRPSQKRTGFVPGPHVSRCIAEQRQSN